MNLKWKDTDKPTSLTYQRMTHLHDEVKGIFKQYERLYDFESYLTYTLYQDGELSMDEVNRARAMLDHCPDMTVSEIFREVFPFRPARPQQK